MDFLAFEGETQAQKGPKAGKARLGAQRPAEGWAAGPRSGRPSRQRRRRAEQTCELRDSPTRL